RVATGYPDPRFMVTWFVDPIETRLGPQEWNASLSQKIPFPGKLKKAGEVVRVEAGIARLNLDKTVRDVAISVSESYYELLYIQEARRIAAQNADLLAQLRKIGETAYARDKASFMDVVKGQSQEGQLRYDILLLEELEETEKTRLNGLLNRLPDAPLGRLKASPPAPVVYELEEIYRLAEANLEEILISDARVVRAETRVELAKLKNFPDFNVGLFYASIGRPDVPTPPPNAGEDALGVQFGMNIPLWFGKNRGRAEGARAEAEKARASKAVWINKTRGRIRVQFFKLRNARRLMDLYEGELLPRAMKSVQTAETWLREGQGSFSDLVETRAAAYNFQLSIARAMADYGKALAKLEGLAGRSLTSRRAPTPAEEAP
ncbi:MAG: TolC family protein, partial [Desulfobacterales bacterium]|nr:TolC family protein [Desulfobacterales bacterium]